jgi:cytoskeleton protein RodZ
MFEIGNTLREARMRRSLDISDCESATKIRAKYLRAMEEEHFDLLPSPAYVRGFLRTYAEHLSLDGQLVLDEYESRFGALDLPGDPDNRRVRSTGRPRQATSNSRRQTPGRGRRRTEAQLLWLAIVGVMGLALIVWMGVGNSENGDRTAIQPASGSTDVTTVPSPDPDPSRAEAAVDNKKLKIRITAADAETWVSVRGRNAQGTTVLAEILPAGGTKSWRVDRSIYIEVARPEVLQVSVNGTTYPFTGGTKFLVTKDGPSLISG